MKIVKNVKKTIGDWLSLLSEGEQTKYIFSLEEVKDINENILTIVMGKFAAKEEFKELYAATLEKTKNIIAICPDDITVKEARDFSRSLYKECPTYICSDGFILAPAKSKGYTLTLTMPIWNEGETLRDVIESFLPICDEIVIRH